MEINSYQTDILGYALCNPMFTTPRGYEWVRCWSPSQQEVRKLFKNGIEYESVIFKDVEEAYQKLKTGTQQDKFKLMVELLKAKFKQYPWLVSQITEKGGVGFLYQCTHQPTSKNTFWETKGENGFIKALCVAYIYCV